MVEAAVARAWNREPRVPASFQRLEAADEGSRLEGVWK